MLPGMTRVEPGRPRAAALPVEERRAAIVAAALPLFLDHGEGFTTREVAQAAGIAEGTIFRVFEDKSALIDALLDKALDAAPVERALARIDHELPLEERLVAAVDILRKRVAHVFRVISAAEETTGGRRGVKQRPTPELHELVALIEPDADALNRTPRETARLLRNLTFACTHPAATLGEPLASREIVSVLLHGIATDDGRLDDSRRPARRGRRC
jgi:AcrR family transcriptional regulator